MSLLEMSSATDGMSQDAWGRLNLACREQQVILDNAGAGIAFMRSRCIVRCNQRFVEIYGFGSTLKAVGCSTVARIERPQPLRCSRGSMGRVGPAGRPSASLRPR